MPIYEYECDKCGTVEVTQKIKDGPLRKCPNCKGKVRKLMSQTSFQLKGSGWYATDYKKAESAGGNGKKKKEESAAPKVEPVKSDSGKESPASKS